MAVTKLVTSIEKALALDRTAKVNELPEMKLLKKLCQEVDPVVSQTACQGMVSLVEIGALKVTSTMSEFLASVPFIVNYNGIIVSITNLLVLEMKRSRMCNDSPLKSVYHPFVMLLKQKKTDNIWFDILVQMRLLCNHHDKEVSVNAIKLLEPVFLYILCDTSNELPMACQHQTWSLLLRSAHSQDATELIVDILSWLQRGSNEAFMNTSAMYLTLAEVSLDRDDIELCIALAPSLASLGHDALERGHDPRLCLSVLDKLLKDQTEPSSCVLMLLADSLKLCPAIYFSHLLSTCLLIVEQGTYNVLAGHMLYCAVLPWLVYPSSLTSDGLKLAARLLHGALKGATSDSQHLCINEWLCQLQNTDNRIDFATELCELTDRWIENAATILPWLESLTLVPDGLTNEFCLFLSALLLHDFGQDNVKSMCLTLLLTKAVKCSEVATSFLPVLLYKIARESQPEFLLELLQGLVSLAVHKENIPIVVSTLESLKQDERMLCLVIDLYMRLWQIESRCYSYLQPLLLQTANTSWTLDITRAAAIKEICEIRPEQHGTELVALLSQLLNNCVDEKQKVAASLALQGITALCQADIVDIVTTWRVLSPRLNYDSRTLVTVRLCEFFSILPSIATGAEYEALIEEAVSKLWSFVSSNASVELTKAALVSLSKFSLVHMSLKSLPEQYHGQLKLPKEFTKTPADVAKKPEEVLSYVPGSCWILLLENISPECLHTAGDLLIGWIDAELSEYRGGIYQVPASGEPANYHHLHLRSVLRAVADRLRIDANKPSLTDDKLVRECLRILSHNYAKPLPPYNWSFLQQLTDLRKHCLAVATKQSLTSPSARRFIDNHLSLMQPTAHAKEDILDLFTILGDLCKGIPPSNLRPSIEKSLQLALAEGCEDLLTQLFGHIKTALRQPDIHADNRTLLASQVEVLLAKLSPDQKVFPAYVACVSELPAERVEQFSSPSLWWESSEAKLRGAVTIRCSMARRLDQEAPLVWLNECIDVITNIPGKHTHLLQEIYSVVVGCQSHVGNWRWVLELLGRIQSVISSLAKHQNVEFLCNVLMMAVIVLAGHDCRLSVPKSIATSLKARLRLFPQALAALTTQTSEKDMGLVVEWLHSMQCCPLVSSMYNAVFRQGLLAMRHRSYFHKFSVLERIINKT